MDHGFAKNGLGKYQTILLVQNATYSSTIHRTIRRQMYKYSFAEGIQNDFPTENA